MDYVTVVARHELGGRILPVAFPWNERLWITQLETATVCRDGRIEFCFKKQVQGCKIAISRLQKVAWFCKL